MSILLLHVHCEHHEVRIVGVIITLKVLDMHTEWLQGSFLIWAMANDSKVKLQISVLNGLRA